MRNMRKTLVLNFLGIMKLSDLKHIFKSSSVSSTDTRSYIVSLLNKFEVALTWDNCSLLIPSLLPSEEDFNTPFSSAVRVKVRYFKLILLKIPI